MIITRLSKVFESDNLNLSVFSIVIISLCLGLSSNKWILTNEIYYEYFSENVDPDRIQQEVDKTRNFNTVKVIWATTSHLLGALGTAFCLSLGCLYYDQKISFRKLFNICLNSSFIFLIPIFLKLTYFIFSGNLSLSDYNNFHPFSLIFFASPFDPFWLKTILELLNLFELIYVVALVFGIRASLNCDFEESLRLVFPSYILGLLLWITVKIFIQLAVFN